MRSARGQGAPSPARAAASVVAEDVIRQGMASPPPKQLKWGNIFLVLVVLGGAAFAAYWFGIR